MLFEDINGYDDLNSLLAIPGMPSKYNYAYSYQNNNEKLSSSFLRGNMFDDEFVPYKNMEYIIPDIKSVKEQELAKIMETTFAVIDYNLYLDVNPDDQMILKKYNEKTEKLEMLIKNYEMNYGPLCMTKGGYDTYKWISSPWPWEKDGGMYV